LSRESGSQGPSSLRLTNGETGVLPLCRAVRTGEDARLSTNHSEVEPPALTGELGRGTVGE
jgi:hypothetical protein